MNTYSEAIEFWYGRIDFEKRPARPGELKLDRMRQLLQLLGNPHKHLRIIHVAGTKGKGSTCAMLASVLGQAGYRVGLFTSPHLSDVRERIQINNELITEVEVLARMREIRVAIQEMVAEDPQNIPTFFEISTALGFLHFYYRWVDWAVIEVGLGGRFDSTNVCTPRLSLITNISYDHMAILGDTLGKIAFEKAGIIKNRVPVVVTAEAEEARQVIEYVADERSAPIKLLDRDFVLKYAEEAGSFEYQAKGKKTWRGPYRAGLPGPHQARNAAGVIAACDILKNMGASISEEAIQLGLQEVRWPGRFEQLRQQPTVIVDCAHNVASAEALVNTLKCLPAGTKKKILIVAISTDKEVARTLAVWAPAFDVAIATQYANNPRRTRPEVIAEHLREANPNLPVHLAETAEGALAKAYELASPEDAIVISGSVFLAGEMRELLAATEAK